MFKGNNWLRDLIFAAVLVVLIKEVVLPYLRSNVPATPQQTEETRFHDIGEEGKILIAKAKDLSEHIDELLVSARLRQGFVGQAAALERLKGIKTELKDIITQYTKDSPASALLGPLGSAATVLKESKLKDKFTSLMNEFKQIGRKLAETETTELKEIEINQE